jgi:tape measure domain-containing protein
MSNRLSWTFALFDKMSGPSSRIEKRLRALGGELKRTDKQTEKTTRQTERHSHAMGKAERATRKLGDAHRHAGKHGAGFFMKLTGWYMSMQMGIMMVQGLTRALFGLPTAFARAGLSAASFKEQSLLGLGTMLGSQGAGESMFAEADRMAKATGTDLREMVGRYTQLTAMGFKGEQMRQVLAGVGDLSIVGGQEKGSRALLAITQIKAKGRLSAEELMQQLAETGVDIDAVYGILGRRTGRDKPGVLKAMEKGEIGADLGIESILEFIQGRYSGGKLGSMAAKNANTGAGLWTNLKSSLDRFLMDLDKSEGYRKAKQALRNLVSVLDPETPEGKRLKARATEMFDRMMGGLLDRFQDPQAVEKWIGGLIDGFGKLIPTVERLASAVSGIAGNVDKIIGGLEMLRKLTPAGWFAEALDFANEGPKSEQDALAKHYEVLKRQPRAWNTDKQMRHIEGRFRSEGWTLPGASPEMAPSHAGASPVLAPSHKPTSMHLAPGAIRIEVNGAQDPKAVGDEIEERLASFFDRLGMAQGVA